MEKFEILQSAETARMQLLATTAPDVVLSWGISDFAAACFKGMPALCFKVNGRLFQGTVVIALNGADYYEIYLLDLKGEKCICEECCFDEMGDIIDRNIERGDDIKAYHQFCQQERKRLFMGDIG
jgi:hypothetical protein